MDTAWEFRSAYDHARGIKEAQDAFCDKATRGDWAGLGEYPENLQWEALVDVLRGRVKVRSVTLHHCANLKSLSGTNALLRDRRSR